MFTMGWKMTKPLIKMGDNSAGIVLPAEWLRKNGLEAGDVVEVDMDEDKLIIKKEK